MGPELQLEAIILPEAVNAYWSPTLTKLVSSIAFVLIAIAVLFAVQYYRKRHYREALQALSEMKDSELVKIYPVNMLLKQLAGKYLPFVQVSSLSGDDWMTFLNQHSSLSKPNSHLAELASDQRFSKNGNTKVQPAHLRAAVEQWIKNADLHKPAAARTMSEKKLAGGQNV